MKSPSKPGKPTLFLCNDVVFHKNTNRILMVTSTFFPVIGGAEVLIYELARSLVKKGYKVTIICPKSQNSAVKDLAGIKVLSLLEQKGKAGFLKNICRTLVFLFMHHREIDIMHAHFAFPSGFMAAFCRLFGIPVIITSYGSDIQVSAEASYGVRRNKIAAVLTWLALKLANVHVVLCRSMIEEAIHAGSDPKKIRVIHDGINSDEIVAGQTRIIERLELPPSDVVVLYLGRLHPKKRPEDLIKAAVKVLKIGQKAKFVIAGKGEEKAKLERLVKKLGLTNNVIFAGFVSDAEKWDLLTRADVFVLPSLMEGQPVTVLEAMACGIPIIATNRGPFPEMINSSMGVLVPPRDQEALAEAIMRLVMDRELRHSMGAKCAKTVEERYTVERMVENYETIYKVVSSKKTH